MREQKLLFQECDHRHTAVVPEKRDSIHEAKLICSDCKKFIRWMPKPETVQRQAANAVTLTALAKLDKLDEWTRNFVRSISGLGHLSPKQQKILDDLRQRYLSQ